MASDERVENTLKVLSGPIQSFRSTLVTTAEQVRGYLASRAAQNGSGAGHLEPEFGIFGTGRLDFDRLAGLIGDSPSIPPPAVEAVEKAQRVLSDLAGQGDDAFVIDVPAGGSLRDAVARALDGIGRVFGAARVVEQCKSGGALPAEEREALAAFPYRRWNKAQRQLAPPLVVHVNGGDLHAAALAEFLDGAQKIVLVVRGESAPAPLVRLITPGVFVLQTADQTGLDRLVAWRGPGVAAIVPEGAALFVHDPTGGPNLPDRLTVTHLPSEAPRKRLDGLSAAQQAAELEQLRALAEQVTAAPAGRAAATPAADPVDKLASWLIHQAGLD